MHATDTMNICNFVQSLTYFHFASVQMKLQGDKSGRKGHLSVATEVIRLSFLFVNLSTVMHAHEDAKVISDG